MPQRRACVSAGNLQRSQGPQSKRKGAGRAREKEWRWMPPALLALLSLLLVAVPSPLCVVAPG